MHRRKFVFSSLFDTFSFMPALMLAFMLIIFCMLTNSRLSLYYALTGLELWYNNMIPTLLPFMILSGTMVRMGLTEGFTTLVYPIIRPIFRVSRNVCYVMIMGFLCGFPMGAKCVNDLYVRGRLTRREAEYLLAFCNNIGPVYFISFALPLIGSRQIGACLFGMYGIPLIYGIFLRYTNYRELGVCPAVPENHETSAAQNLPTCLDEAIFSSLQSILMLGGYMILFNLLMLLPHLLLGEKMCWVAPLLEITGGLKLLGDRLPCYSLILLPFGGLSCIAQTYSCIRQTDLSISNYIFHKLILTALTAVYYLAGNLLPYLPRLLFLRL
jgi:sporulation integral membrane protein YlbJ